MNYLTKLKAKFAALILIYSLFAVFFAGSLGCLTRITGGRVTHGQTVLQQSQDPKAPSTLNEEKAHDETLILPAGSLLMVGTNSFKVSSNTVYTIHNSDKIQSTLGAANKNTLQETAAKLASLSWVSYAGVALFLLGLGTIFYPPLKLLVGGSLTTGVAIAGGGLLLTVLPVLVVGHEILIMCGVLAGVAIWFIAHRHGSLKGELTVLKDFVAPKTEANIVQLKPESK